VIVRRRFNRALSSRFFLALLLGALVALTVPTLAAAAKFKVTGAGDSVEPPVKTACETGVGECTLRAAIADANVASGLDEITFGSAFDGGPGSMIALGSVLSISQPVKILGSIIAAPGGSIPAATVHVSGTAIQISAAETVIEDLGIEASSIGVQILGGRGAKIRNNFISGVVSNSPQAGVEINPGNGSTGNLIEGNRIQAPGYSNWGIAIQYGANQIFGNEIEGGREGIANDGCCYQGIYVESSGAGNQIGGDTPESENVITNFWYGAIWINTSNHNEIGRNRGLSTSSGFIATGGSTPAPTIAGAAQPKVTGTADPGALVRVFTTQSESLNEIEGFVGQATADPTTGNWEVSLAGVPVGTLVTATETFEGSTSGLSATVAVTAEPPPSGGGGSGGGGEAGGGSGEGGGSNSGGSGNSGAGGGGTSQSSSQIQTQALNAAPPKPTAPVTRITKGPAKSSKATTARFRFTATPASGATFQCNFDNARWSSCRSLKTYRKLKPGKHTFQVRATASGLTGPATKFKFTAKA
jgi:hypothetical protein